LLTAALFACGQKAEDPSTADPSASDPSSSAPTESAPPDSDNGPDSQTPEQPGSSESEKKYGGTLRIIGHTEGASPIGIPWNPASADAELQHPFMETLFIRKYSGEILPFIGQEIIPDMENLKATVTIRPGVFFSDGSELTGEVAAWNFRMSAAAPTGNKRVIDVQATGDYEFTLYYDEWSNNYQEGIASLVMCSKESYEKNGEEWAADNPVGTGPFIMTEYIMGQYLKGVRNPNYWQEGKPYLDGLEFHFVRDEMAQTIAIQNDGPDGVHVLNSSNPEQVKTLADLGYTVAQAANGPISLIPSGANADSPFADVRVRQAVAYAVDRDLLCTARGFGLWQPATQLPQTIYTAYIDEPGFGYGYDPAKAKELLAEAGYPDGFKTKMIPQPAMVDRDTVVAIQSMLAAVGIECELEFPDSGGYMSLRNGGWEGMLLHPLRIGPDFSTYMQLYFDYNDKYMVSAKRPDNWEAMTRDAASTVDIEEAKVEALNRALFDTVTAAPIYQHIDNWVQRPNVHDSNLYVYMLINFSDLWLS
jgi:peptide/nickel transport system substrate-binding protein